MSHGWADLGVVRGPQGPPGEQGPPGLNGSQGNPGTPGTNGTNGTNGLSVLSGARAPAAGDGLPGEFWIDTRTPVTIWGPKGASAWPGSGVSLVGPQGGQGNPGAPGTNGTNGAPGANGNTILSGASGPTTGQGVTGDFFLNTTTGLLFGPRQAGGWPGSGVRAFWPDPGSMATLANPAGISGHFRYRDGVEPNTWFLDVVVSWSAQTTYSFPSMPAPGFNLSGGGANLARIYPIQGNASSTGQIARLWLSGQAVQIITSSTGGTGAWTGHVPKGGTN